MKKTKKALITQEKSQLLPEPEAFSALETEEKLKVVERYLTSSLAMYVLLQADKPISVTLNKLFDLEVEAATVIDEYMQTRKAIAYKPNLRGALSGTFSFIQMGRPTTEIKECTPSRAEEKQNPKTKASPKFRKSQKKVRT